MSDSDEALGAEASRSLLDQAMATWVLPEMERLGLSQELLVERGVILFPPKGESKVIL